MPSALLVRQVRRAQIAAQGLTAARPRGPVTRGHLARLTDRLGLLQIDSISVLARAHYLPVMARLGPFDTAVLDRATNRAPRMLVETWSHEASFVLPETYRLQSARRDAAWARFDGRSPELRAHYEDILEAVSGAPLTARELHARLGHAAAEKERWGWNWSPLREAVEVLWRGGRLAVAARNSQFERLWALPESVLPPVALGPAPAWPDAVDELVALAARSLGVATVSSLADYHRIAVRSAADAVARLVDAGRLRRLDVAGWRRPAYAPAGFAERGPVRARALLAPFDPLVFDRTRLLDSWGMHYRIGVYTPAERRTHGYYALPFLLGEHLVARVDLKADRASGRLLVRHATLEDPGLVPDLPTRGSAAWPAPGEIAAELAAELGEMARWLGLDVVAPDERAAGDLVPPLTSALAVAEARASG